MSLRRSQSGFTIIELMIAISVFSILLLVLTATIIQIGQLYDKGVNASRTQAVARSVLDDVTQAIQFTSGNITTCIYDTSTSTCNPPLTLGTDNNVAASASSLSVLTCIGSQALMYRFGQQVQLPSQHGLLLTTDGSCTGQDLTAVGNHAGTELLGNKMRLARLLIKQDTTNTDVYDVTVRVIYGDDDLICTDSATIPCNGDSTETSADLAKSPDLRCRDVNSGGQFCSESELTTTVERRVN